MISEKGCVENNCRVRLSKMGLRLEKNDVMFNVLSGKEIVLKDQLIWNVEDWINEHMC